MAKLETGGNSGSAKKGGDVIDAASEVHGVLNSCVCNVYVLQGDGDSEEVMKGMVKSNICNEGNNRRIIGKLFQTEIDIKSKFSLDFRENDSIWR